MRDEGDVGPGGVGVLRDEQPAEAGRRPERAGVARRALGGDDDAAGAIGAVDVARQIARAGGWRSPASIRPGTGTRRRAAPSRRTSPPADPPMNRQLASSAAWLPPLFCVRHTCWNAGELRVGVDLVEREELPAGRRGDGGALVGGADRIVGAHPAREIAVREVGEEAVALEAGEQHVRRATDGSPTPTCRRRTGTALFQTPGAPVPSSQIVPLSCRPPIMPLQRRARIERDVVELQRLQSAVQEVQPRRHRRRASSGTAARCRTAAGSGC